MASRTLKTEAVVLRSMRLGEADRVLHLYTLDRGRVGAVAKGIRRTKSRFGARLEPLSHVECLLHVGGGELHTITGVDLVRSHHAAREDAYRPGVGGAVCRGCAGGGALALSPEGLTGMTALLRTPLAGALSAGLGDRAARDCLAVISSSYEYHGGFRLRTLSA